MSISIYIPTLRRIDRQRTLDHLPPKVAKRAVLVCPPDELAAHRAAGRTALACPCKGITPTRDWILQTALHAGQKHIVMLDDDLIIQRRRADGRITNATPDEVEAALAWLDATLKTHAHCALAARFLGYGATAEYAEPSRAMYALAYNVPRVAATGATFGHGLPTKGTVMEDMNMTLQLLMRGLPNRVSLAWRVAPGASNIHGGCSAWRSTAGQVASAQALQRMFPAVVRLRSKKAWQGMDEGLVDVTVQWRKALRLAGAQFRMPTPLPLRDVLIRIARGCGPAVGAV